MKLVKLEVAEGGAEIWINPDQIATVRHIGGAEITEITLHNKQFFTTFEPLQRFFDRLDESRKASA